MLSEVPATCFLRYPQPVGYTPLFTQFQQHAFGRNLQVVPLTRLIADMLAIAYT